MLELNDIQGLLIHGRAHGFARYIFLRIDVPEDGRRWLGHLVGELTTAERRPDPISATVNVALTHAGLAAIGVPSTSLESFPEEFRAGMPARRHLLGDVGPSSPEHWSGGLGTPDLHAMLVVFAS